jgi:histidinol dehydrogenase
MITVLKWNKLSESEQKKVLERPAFKINNDIQGKVASIILKVRQEGDGAVKEFTELFDQTKLTELRVSQNELQKAQEAISNDGHEAIIFARDQISNFHQLQFQQEQSIKVANDAFCSRQTRPIQTVGLYVPGGEAPLPSTVLMLGVPAKIAGCKRIVVCTPPNKKGEINPYILAAAKVCGINEIYKIGGAQAIAAMAYGTQSVPKVDKIFGPGNAWVTAAKLTVMNDLEGAHCDLPAGPSELLIICDDQANPEFIAADLLSQAEHSVDAQVLLITTSEEMAKSVQDALNKQLAQLNRQTICQQSLRFSKIIIVDKLATAFLISEIYAPEHLSIQIKDANEWLPSIHNAGAVFIGEWTAQTLGDYVLGSNHVLPTSGFSKVYGGLCINDFLKYINFHHVSPTSYKDISKHAMSLANIEQLDAHQNAVAIRLRSLV